MKYSVNRAVHSDFNVIEENKLPARAYFIPFSNNDALSKTNYKNERYNSDRVVMLSGEWDFKYYNKLSYIPSILEFDNGSAIFGKNEGLISYNVNDFEYLNQNPLDKQSGFVPHIYRGRLDNDQYMVIFWKIIGLDCSNAKLVSCKVKNKNGEKYVSTVYDFVTRGIFVLARADVDYFFEKNGKMRITASLKKVCPLTDQLPRFGVHCELPKVFENVEYYGRGPVENYSDFKEHSPIGIYNSTVSNMAHKYIKPQDSGNRGEARYSIITNDNGFGFRISAVDEYFNFNANHFTLGQLKNAKHIEDLPDTDTTFVAIDGFVRGTGSGSCGPIPPKEHQIKFDYASPLVYSFEVEPIK